MTLVGCGVLWVVLLLVILTAWVPMLRWTIVPLLVVFLGMQFLRYFLPKPGSSTGTPELGEEVASEGEALIQAFKTGQLFLHVGGMEGSTGGEWRRQPGDRETGCRPKLSFSRSAHEFSDDQGRMIWSFERPTALRGDMC